jgi:prepilin-type N-terminal cleavage/methylation domain-containing protein
MGRFTKRWRKLNGQKGFTLLEVLAAVTILSVASLAMTSFFVQAMSYSKKNENKTVAVNLARNALFFLEKQDFARFDVYLSKTAGNPPISPTGCSKLADRTVSCPSYPALSDLFNQTDNLWEVLNPVINGLPYAVTVTYNPSTLADPTKKNLNKYLLSVTVAVRNADSGSVGTILAVVGGYIPDEKIR